MTRRVAIDVGGTFTDVCVVESNGDSLRVTKVPTTVDPIDGVLGAITDSGLDLAEVDFFAHGTTVATNALINRTFPRAALVTTRGFRDVIEIGSGTKVDLWDAYDDVAPPYIARRDRLVVSERIDATGRVITPLSVSDAEAVIEVLRRRGVETVAICFLNSYINPTHEREMAELLSAALPDVAISTSSAVLPEIAEHERFSTTVVNALLSPLIQRYTVNLERRLDAHGYRGRVHFLHGGGGVMTGAAAQRFAGRLASSGVAAGAIASKHIALSCGFDNSMGLDIGGTSADLSIVVAGESRIVRNWYVDYGHPICFPSLEVLTIGAGGGSIAWVDDGGAVRVGPVSAGALPGPACYGMGGEFATVTDAQLCLGRIATSLAGGSRILEPARAVAAVAQIASKLGCSVEDAADGILRVAASAMADALRLLSVSRGHDPRDFALVAFGGAGPLHAVELARELGVAEVVIPGYPGATSALGCLLVDTRHDHSTMFIRDIQSADPYEVESIFLELEAKSRASLRDDHVAPSRMSLQRLIEMRYSGQSRSLPIAIDGPVAGLDGLVAQFHEQHEREFGFSQRGADVELYQLAVTAFGVIDKPQIIPSSFGRGPMTPVSYRQVRFTRERTNQETPVYDRAALFPGAQIAGPAVVSQPDSTTLLPPGSAAVVDESLNLRITPWTKDRA